MSEIEFSSTLELRISKVDNRLTANLGIDSPSGNIGKFANVCDILANGFLYKSNTTAIDIGSPAIKIYTSTKSPVPLSLVGSNYNGGGKFRFQIVADGTIVETVSDSLDPWQSKQWMFMIQPPTTAPKSKTRTVALFQFGEKKVLSPDASDAMFNRSNAPLLAVDITSQALIGPYGSKYYPLNFGEQWKATINTNNYPGWKFTTCAPLSRDVNCAITSEDAFAQNISNDGTVLTITAPPSSSGSSFDYEFGFGLEDGNGTKFVWDPRMQSLPPD